MKQNQTVRFILFFKFYLQMKVIFRTENQFIANLNFIFFHIFPLNIFFFTQKYRKTKQKQRKSVYFGLFWFILLCFIFSEEKTNQNKLNQNKMELKQNKIKVFHIDETKTKTKEKNHFVLINKTK